MLIDKSVIILDNLEGILSAAGDYLRKENALVLKLISLMNSSQLSNKCMIIATAQDEKALNNIGLSSYFNENHHLSGLHLSYENSLPLELIASRFNIQLTSNQDEILSLNSVLTIKQVLYLLIKLVSDEASVDKLLFFKSAMSLYGNQKMIRDKDNNKTFPLPYTSVFSMRKSNT